MKVGTTHDGRRGRAFELPIEAVTQTFAILGLRGSGKSNAAKKLAEEMYDAGAQWVAIDPKGDWHGLRSSADGKRPGLSIPVFGGLHGDMPLAATAGAVMAPPCAASSPSSGPGTSSPRAAPSGPHYEACIEKAKRAAPAIATWDGAHHLVQVILRGVADGLADAWERTAR